jgi:hypothetical protein
MLASFTIRIAQVWMFMIALYVFALFRDARLGTLRYRSWCCWPSFSTFICLLRFGLRLKFSVVISLP